MKAFEDGHGSGLCLILLRLHGPSGRLMRRPALPPQRSISGSVHRAQVGTMLRLHHVMTKLLLVSAGDEACQTNTPRSAPGDIMTTKSATDQVPGARMTGMQAVGMIGRGHAKMIATGRVIVMLMMVGLAVMKGSAVGALVRTILL